MNLDLNNLLKRMAQGRAEEKTIEPVTFAPTIALTEKELDELAFLQQIAARRRRWLIFLTSVALLLAVLTIIFCANYALIKSWRARSLAHHAMINLGQQNFLMADSDMHAAYLLNRDDPEVLRTVAHILTVEKDPKALVYWKKLIDTRAAQPEDLRSTAAVALQAGNDVEARPLIETLLRQEPGNPRNLLLAARLMVRTHRISDAISLAQKTLILDPNYGSATVFLAETEMADPLYHEEGKNRLFELAASNDAYGLVALEKLATIPDLSPDQIEEVVTRLRNHPLAEEANKIMAVALEIKSKPDQRDALLTQVVTDHKDSEPAIKRQFAVWLNSIGEHDRVLTLLPLNAALQNTDYFLIYADTLADMRRWAELQTVLTQDKVPLAPAYVDLYLSRCASELGNDGASNAYWREAVVQAANNPSESLYLANYSERMGRPDRAIGLYQTLSQTSTTARAAYGALLRLSKDGDTKSLRDLLDQVLIHFPEDESIRNDDAYFNLLLNSRVPEMTKTAEALVQEDEFSLPHRTVLALARLRSHDPSGAFRIYDHVTTDWSSAPTSALVVRAAVLFANGLPAFADSPMTLLKGRTLRPEEKALLNLP